MTRRCGAAVNLIRAGTLPTPCVLIVFRRAGDGKGHTGRRPSVNPGDAAVSPPRLAQRFHELLEEIKGFVPL
jgi:hypothetical protein